MGGCAALGCSNNAQKGFYLARFPRDEHRRRIWVRFCNRKDWNPESQNHKLCEVHFDKSQFESNRKDGMKKLKPNAIPTICNVLKAHPSKPKYESCVFRECKNRKVKQDTSSERAQLLFFPFPTDPRLRQAWLQAATTPPKLHPEGSVPKICSEHFFPEEFEMDEFGRIKLKPYAIPIVLNTTIVEEELAPKRKRPRKKQELELLTSKPPRVVISLKERWAADARLIQQLEEDIETEEEARCERTRGLASSLSCSETESLRSADSPTPSRPSSAVPPETPDLPSLQLLSYVASQALQDVKREDDDAATENRSRKSSSRNKRPEAQKSSTSSCGAVHNFIAQESKNKSAHIKSRNLIIKEKTAEGGTPRIIDPTLPPYIPSIFLFDESSPSPPSKRAEAVNGRADSSVRNPKTCAFDEPLEKMSVADVEAKHTGVRLRIAILTARNDGLLLEIHRLKRINQQLTEQISRYKDNVTKSTDNLLVVETVPRCDCRKNREPAEAPREDLDAVFGDVASREIPSAEECQLYVEHQEKLIKRIASIKNAFQARGKDIVRVVVIQSEDLPD